MDAPRKKHLPGAARDQGNTVTESAFNSERELSRSTVPTTRTRVSGANFTLPKISSSTSTLIWPVLSLSRKCSRSVNSTIAPVTTTLVSSLAATTSATVDSATWCEAQPMAATPTNSASAELRMSLNGCPGMMYSSIDLGLGRLVATASATDGT